MRRTAPTALVVAALATACSTGAATHRTAATPATPATASAAPATPGTPGGALTAWLGDVYRGDLSGACALTALPPGTSAASCNGVLGSLHENFSQAVHDPAFTVPADATTVTDTQVGVDGRTLHDAVASTKQGNGTADVSLTFTMSRGTTPAAPWLVSFSMDVDASLGS